jgi:hypothetical protein
MGFIARRVVPRSERRAVHPVRTAKSAANRATVPKGVRRTISTAHKVANPISTAGYAAEKAVFGRKPRRSSQSKRSASGTSYGGGYGTSAGSGASASSDRSPGRLFTAALLAVAAFISFFSGAVVLGLFLLMPAVALWSIAAAAKEDEKPPAP